MHPLIEIKNLKQQYGKSVIYNGLNLQIPKVNTIGLVGPNGAGKTTLLKTITGILRPTHGDVFILGHSVLDKKQRRQARSQLSFLPQGFTVDGSLTAREFVEYNLWMRAFPNGSIRAVAQEALEAVELDEHASMKLRKFSGGMKQRAGIAAAIAGEPELVILDEPTAGLDPQQRRGLRQVLRNLTSSVLLSTHLVEDVASLAEHLIVINHGQISYSGSADVLSNTDDNSIDSLEKAYIGLLSS